MYRGTINSYNQLRDVDPAAVADLKAPERVNSSSATFAKELEENIEVDDWFQLTASLSCFSHVLSVCYDFGSNAQRNCVRILTRARINCKR